MQVCGMDIAQYQVVSRLSVGGNLLLRFGNDITAMFVVQGLMSISSVQGIQAIRLN